MRAPTRESMISFTARGPQCARFWRPRSAGLFAWIGNACVGADALVCPAEQSSAMKNSFVRREPTVLQTCHERREATAEQVEVEALSGRLNPLPKSRAKSRELGRRGCLHRE